MNKTFIRLWVGILAVLVVCNTTTVFGADEDETNKGHEAKTESTEDDSAVKVLQATEKIVSAKPELAALTRVLGGMQPVMTAEKFDSLLKDSKVSEAQRPALKEAFTAAGTPDQFKNAVIRAVEALDGQRQDQGVTPATGGAPADGQQAKGEGKGEERGEGKDGKGKDGKEEKDSDLAKLADLVKQAKEKRAAGLDPLAALALRNQGKEGGEKDGGGQGGGQPPGGQPPQGGQPPSESSLSSKEPPHDPGSRDRRDNNSNRNNNNNGNNNNGNNNNSSNAKSKDDDDKDSSDDKKSSLSTASSLLDGINKSKDDLDSSKLKEAEKALKDLPAGDGAPVTPPRYQAYNGPKSSPSAISKGGGGFPGGFPSFGGGGGGGDGGSALGGPVKGGGGGGGGGVMSGGFDLGGMRFDQDRPEYGGPPPSFGKDGVYAGASGGGGTLAMGDATTNNGDAEAEGTKRIPPFAQVIATGSDSGPRHILERFAGNGKLVKPVCGSTTPGKVEFCFNAPLKNITGKYPEDFSSITGVSVENRI